MIQSTALAKFSAMYPKLTWVQLWNTAAQDPELVDAIAQLQSVGYNPVSFVTDAYKQGAAYVEAHYPKVFQAASLLQLPQIPSAPSAQAAAAAPSAQAAAAAQSTDIPMWAWIAGGAAAIAGGWMLFGRRVARNQ